MSAGKVNCSDRERIFENGTAAEWTALEAHALGCQACAEELRGWNALSVAARELRDHSEDAALWARIEKSLEDQASIQAQRRDQWASLAFWKHVGWQQAMAGALVLAFTVSAAWFYVNRGAGPPPSGVLLKSKEVREVERAEAAYIKAIDQMAREAKPELENPATPLLANYREKLQVLDSAIQELRAETDRNPGNTQVRRQLLAMYQEKQMTLQDVLGQKALEEKR